MPHEACAPRALQSSKTVTLQIHRGRSALRARPCSRLRARARVRRRGPSLPQLSCLGPPKQGRTIAIACSSLGTHRGSIGFSSRFLVRLTELFQLGNAPPLHQASRIDRARFAQRAIEGTALDGVVYAVLIWMEPCSTPGQPALFINLNAHLTRVVNAYHSDQS